MPGPIFFTSPAQLRDWFAQNHESAAELFVGYRRKASGLPTLTWSDSVDQALCFGWIDGVRRGIDETSYCNRFTPRRRGSNWSAVNLRKVEALLAAGLMEPAGIRAYEARDIAKAGYSYESPEVALTPDLEGALRGDRAAHEFHARQPPGYRRLANRWIMNAKQPQTRLRRLGQLIDAAAAGRRLDALLSPSQRTSAGPDQKNL